MLGKALGIELYPTCKALKKFPIVFRGYPLSMDIQFTKRRKLMPILKSRGDVILY
jgi:hypothetical protein